MTTPVRSSSKKTGEVKSNEYLGNYKCVCGAKAIVEKGRVTPLHQVLCPVRMHLRSRHPQLRAVRS
jgi:hypothetical protein